MLRKRLEAGRLERCYSPYRNPYFLVKKKEANKYRLVFAAMLINAVIIRDTNLPPNVDKFIEEFSGIAVTLLINLFSGYNQFLLAEKHRDLIANMTLLGLLRIIRLP